MLSQDGERKVRRLSNVCYKPDGVCMFIKEDGTCGYVIVGPCSYLTDRPSEGKANE